MAKVNKAALAEAIATKVGVSKKEAEDMIAAFENIVTTELLAGNEVTIAGFGAFSAKTRAGRVGVNPQNPSQKIQIPPVTVPKFKAGKALKDALKGKKGADAGATGGAAQVASDDSGMNDTHDTSDETTSFQSDSTM